MMKTGGQSVTANVKKKTYNLDAEMIETVRRLW
jgi:hypothetical protein